ncbi:hypothetical protein N7454_003908 [Penicillium verhagenii]|nr:hypothetical protein N7454_003908 [Penicillium verhagenii]
MTEFKSDGTPVFHAYMDSDLLGEGVQNYRAFRFNWTACYCSAQDPPSGTAVYVSWNGDTETVSWRFFGVTDHYGSRSFLGEVQRTGFETLLIYPGHTYTQVGAEAISAQGRVLRVTAVTRVQSGPVLSFDFAGAGLIPQGTTAGSARKQIVFQG